MQSEWAAMMPLGFLAAGGLLVFCVGAFRQQRPEGLLFALAVAATVGCGLSVLTTAPVPVPFCGMVDGDGYGRFFTLLLSVITLLTLFISRGYANTRGFSGDEFYGLILYAALGMMLVSSATHWVVFFLGLELFAIALYVLIGINKRDPAATEAALKYLIMGAGASGFLTFGMAMVYAATGTLDLAQSLGVRLGTAPGTTLFLGLGLILVGVGFKLSLVPFHLWTPDVYQGAPLPVTAFLSTGSKVALLAVLLRISLSASVALWAVLMPILWGLAALTMLVGNVTALAQNHVKRLLAYSSVAQMGYLLMALVAVKQNGAPAVVFYSVIYALMDLGAFGTLAMLSGEKEERDALIDCRGLGYSHPWQAGVLAVCLLSLAGLPPTAGFTGKFLLFRAAIQGGFLVLAVIGILAAIVSVYFYLKVLAALYMRPPEAAPVSLEADWLGRLATAALLFLILVLGLLPSPFLDRIARVLVTLTI